MEPLKETDFMLSQFHMTLTKVLLKMTSTLGFCPLYVDPVRGKLTINYWSWARTTQNWLWIVCYAWLVLPTHAVEVWLYSKNVHSIRGNPTIIYLVMGIIYCSIYTLFLGVTTLKPLIFCQHINGFYKYIQTFPVPLYPAYRVPAYALSLPFYLISCTWFSVSGLNYVAVSVVFSTAAICHFFTMFPILKNELRLGQLSYKTDDKLRQPHHLITNYRAIQILMKTFNIEMGIIIVPIQICVTTSTVVANVFLIFQWEMFRVNTKILLLGVMLTGFVVWSSFLWVAGLQYKESKITVESWHWTNWKRKEDRMYMKRVTPTCQPMTFGDGKRFVINPTKVLQFFKSVSKNTFMAVATYGEVFGY
ncbi:unnamed protein product [Orchesella dallaii]|uniref:Odorant receptor n=1 Tax=Orchesella dallaii TaxID=48710 RepID=A0ABP1Q3D1_9HEXA